MSPSPGALKKVRRLLEQAERGEPVSQDEAGAVLALLRPRVKKRTAGSTIKQDRAAKKLSKRERSRAVWEEVDRRAAGRCEAAVVASEFLPPCAGFLEGDHFLGGSGRRKQEESPATCWNICNAHHQLRTHNQPSAGLWNFIFRAHCKRHGLPVVEHIEHQQLQRRGHG